MATIFEELAKRLRRTDLLLLRAVRRQRSRPAMRAKGQFWGSVITDDEVDALLRAHGEIDYPAGSDGLDEAVGASAALRDEAGGRFGRLREAMDLDGDDADMILLSIAPEISAGYGKIFAYLNDNLNQAYLTVDLATRVLRSGRTERLALQSRLMKNAPLIQNRLLLLNPEEGVETHTARRVHPSGRLLQWLLEGQELPESVGFKPIDTSGEVFTPAATGERIQIIEQSLDKPITIVITGATLGSREGVTIDIAQRAKRPLVRVDLDRCRHYIEQPYDLIRELRLSGALPFLVNISDQQEDPMLRIQVQQLGAALAKLPYPVIVGGTDRRSVGGLLGGDRPSLTVQVQRSTLDERIEAWTVAMGKRGWSVANGQDVAERFTP